MNQQKCTGVCLVVGSLVLGACSADGGDMSVNPNTGASASGQVEVLDLDGDHELVALDAAGNPIEKGPASGPGRHALAYVLAGPRWKKPVVSYYVDSSDARLKQAATNSFNAWDSVTKDLDFKQLSSATGADIVVSFDASLPTGVGGRTSSPYLSTGEYYPGATIKINPAGLVATHDNFLLAVVMHEAGHAIGMDHSTVNTAVMKTTITIQNGVPLVNYLIEEDIKGIESLYGIPNSETYRYLPWPWRVLGTSATVNNQYNQWPFVDIDISKFRNSTLKLSIVCDKGTVGCK